jgi:hypothetical protein
LPFRGARRGMPGSLPNDFFVAWQHVFGDVARRLDLSQAGSEIAGAPQDPVQGFSRSPNNCVGIAVPAFSRDVRIDRRVSRTHRLPVPEKTRFELFDRQAIHHLHSRPAALRPSLQASSMRRSIHALLKLSTGTRHGVIAITCAALLAGAPLNSLRGLLLQTCLQARDAPWRLRRRRTL